VKRITLETFQIKGSANSGTEETNESVADLKLQVYGRILPLEPPHATIAVLSTEDRSLREATRCRETITIRDVNFSSAMPQRWPDFPQRFLFLISARVPCSETKYPSETLWVMGSQCKVGKPRERKSSPAWRIGVP
jgi:hypothetical protein